MKRKIIGISQSLLCLVLIHCNTLSTKYPKHSDFVGTFVSVSDSSEKIVLEKGKVLNIYQSEGRYTHYFYDSISVLKINEGKWESDAAGASGNYDYSYGEGVVLLYLKDWQSRSTISENPYTFFACAKFDNGTVIIKTFGVAGQKDHRKLIFEKL